MPQRNKILRISLITLAGAVAATALLALDRYGAAHRSVPSWSGTYTATGIIAPVTITRDRHAVPHITGTADADIDFALGFVHAQDRLWQMELFRRIGQGRLSEVVGPAAIEVDRYMRTLGLYRHAKASITHVTPKTGAALKAYAAGVNAYLTLNDKPLPPEFQLLLHKPEPWAPADSAVMLKLLALGLSGNAIQEISRAHLSTQFTQEQIAQLFPPYPGDAPVALTDLAHLYDDTNLHASLPLASRFTPASNNWVLSGGRTQTGKPILANDPHLAMFAPSLWYLAHLAYPDANLVGASIPGLPGVILGRNDWISWGYTTTGGDTQDVYLEKLNPDNRKEYLTPDGWRAFETRTEHISVRFAADQTVTVRSTRHGPVLPAQAFSGKNTDKGHVMALAWPALRDDDTSIDAAMASTRARNWNEFNTALEHYVSPMQNIVYADIHGTIGFIAPAYVPVRGPGHETNGLAPASGWLTKNDWQGFIPFAELPRSRNPQTGEIVTANNKIVPDDYPHLISHRWANPYRAERIKQLLSQTSRHNAEENARFQIDNLSLYAADLTPFLTAVPADGETAEAARLLLAKWDFKMVSGRPEPLIFTAWSRALTRALFADELGSDFTSYWGTRPVATLNVLTGQGSQAAWCDDQTTPDKETCNQQVQSALAAALNDLTEEFGPDIHAWRWEAAHPVSNRHIPGSFIPGFAGSWNIERPSSGGYHTVNRGRYDFTSARPFANVNAAGYRAVYDMANPEASLYMISTGQSGNIFSPAYDEFATAWTQGVYIPIETTPEAYRQDARGKIALKPGT